MILKLIKERSDTRMCGCCKKLYNSPHAPNNSWCHECCKKMSDKRKATQLSSLKNMNAQSLCFYMDDDPEWHFISEYSLCNNIQKNINNICVNKLGISPKEVVREYRIGKKGKIVDFFIKGENGDNIIIEVKKECRKSTPDTYCASGIGQLLLYKTLLPDGNGINVNRMIFISVKYYPSIKKMIDDLNLNIEYYSILTYN